MTARVHKISVARATKPAPIAIVTTNPSNGTAVAGAAATLVPAGAPRGAGARRPRAARQAYAATPRFAAAATNSERLIPSQRINTKPASRVPINAPTVLAVYNQPTRAPAPSERRTATRLSAGNVPPISVVGTSNSAKATAPCVSAAHHDPGGNHAGMASNAVGSPSSTGMRPTTSSAVPSSSPAYRRSGAAERSARRPNTALPSPSPPKKAASTTLTA
jgi:hypothetical protein